jgi:hypothetical protein
MAYFTRHFYNYNEVIASLRLSILLRRHHDAAFWCQELIDSDMFSNAFQVILETWLFCINFTFNEWLHYAKCVYDSENPLALQELCMNLCLSEKRDSSVWSILALQELSVDKLNRNRLKGTNIKLIEDYFKESLKQGRPRSAWWAAQHIPLKILKLMLDSDSIWILNINNSKSWLCALILYSSTSHLYDKYNEKYISIRTKSVEKDISLWESLVGRRKRREICVPIEKIYMCGPRWNMSKSSSNISELYTIEQSISMDTTFWKNTLKKYNLKDDDARENFYRDYFPDDIPDEWSSNDQKKSHGNGMLALSEEFSIHKWMRTWIMGFKSRLCWVYESEIQDIVSIMNFGSSNTWENIWEHISEIPIWKCPDIESQIIPVSRYYIIS